MSKLTLKEAARILHENRWRKLSEEKPTEVGIYLGFVPTWDEPLQYKVLEWPDSDGFWDFVGVTHWKPIDRPEEET
jgi:hypothetical protein